MINCNWISLVPPLIVIGAVCITHQLNISLVFGILIAAIIATHGQVLPAFLLCSKKIILHFSDLDNIYLYLFLIVISSLITLLTVTGIAAGCAQIIGKKMKTKRSVETATIVLSTLLSIDDYLSILTVGFVMRPIADRLAVARTKLAYIIHALAGPLVIIMPISTWAAAILVQLDNAGLQKGGAVSDSFYVYLKTIPFIFYSLFVVFSVWFIVRRRISFGLIAHDEQITIPVQNEKEYVHYDKKHSLFELFMPIMLLIMSVFIGILWAGGYHFFGGNNSFVDAFRNNDKTFLVMLLSGIIAFASSLLLSLYKKIITMKNIPLIVYEGFFLMRSSIIMIFLASILGSFLRIELQTGSYIAHVLLGTAPVYLIPVILFIVSLIITVTTGSAWGTFSLLIPIMTQMLVVFLRLESSIHLDQVYLLYPALGAVLSGAACGNHISPFAETTVMTATSTGIQPLEHARTQFSYTIPVIMSTFISFLIVGILCENNLWMSCFVSIAVGIGLCAVLLILANRFWKK